MAQTTKPRPRFQKPFEYAGQICAAVNAGSLKNGGYSASAMYRFPPLEHFRHPQLGEALLIRGGNIDARPVGSGFGSHLMRKIYPVFSQIAIRTGRPLIHEPSANNAGSKRFFVEHHDYSPVERGNLVSRHFLPDGAPRLLPKHQEMLVELFLGEERYQVTLPKKRVPERFRKTGRF